VVVSKEAVAVAAPQPTDTEQPAVPVRDSNGDVDVIRHVSGGDDNFDPPPPSRSISRFFSWIRGRDRKKGSSGRVAGLISKLKKEIDDGAPFGPSEMGQRLAEIEQLERAEADGEQKRKDGEAKKKLEELVRRKAKERHDEVSEKVAAVEALMTKHGPKHPEMLPKLKELEQLLAHPDLAHPDVAHPNRDKRIDTVRGMRQKVEALNEQEQREAKAKVAKLEAELKKPAEEDDEAARLIEAEAEVKRMKLRMATKAAKRAKSRRAGKKPSAAEEEAEDEEDSEEDEPEVVVIRKPKRKPKAKAKVVVVKQAEEDSDTTDDTE